jgi:hypothetical protein
VVTHFYKEPSFFFSLMMDITEEMDEKIREIMHQKRITYQEAAQIVKSGQKGLESFGFR